MTNNREQQIIQAAGNPTPANEMEVNAEKNSFEKEFSQNEESSFFESINSMYC